MHESPLQPAPPASGGLSYYPARYQATYPNTRAALAALGLQDEAAGLHLANALAEGSELVALPVTGGPEGAEALALIRRMPGGRVELWVGIHQEARADEREAAAVAAEFADAIPGRWCVMQWTRQARAVQ